MITFRFGMDSRNFYNNKFTLSRKQLTIDVRLNYFPDDINYGRNWWDEYNL